MALSLSSSVTYMALPSLLISPSPPQRRTGTRSSATDKAEAQSRPKRRTTAKRSPPVLSLLSQSRKRRRRIADLAVEFHTRNRGLHRALDPRIRVGRRKDRPLGELRGSLQTYGDHVHHSGGSRQVPILGEFIKDIDHLGM